MKVILMESILIERIESVGDFYASKLKELNIESVDDFLNSNLTPEELSEKINVDLKRVQQWYDVINLFMVPKVDLKTAEILYNANVNSYKELSHRQATRIYYKIKEIDEDTYFIILSYPKLSEIEEWVYYAKLMSRRIYNSLNIPLISLGLLSLEQLSYLKMLGIITCEDFEYKISVIPRIRSKLKMSKEDYQKLLDLIDLCSIKGVDPLLAKMLYSAGIKSKELFKKISPEHLLEGTTLGTAKEQIVIKGIKAVIGEFPEITETVDISFIKKIKSTLEGSA